MNYLDKQISNVRENYNYFFIKLCFSILKNIFKFSIMLILSSIFNNTIIYIITIISALYYSCKIIYTILYYLNIINDIKNIMGYEDYSFEINFELLHNDFFKGEIKYGK